MKKLTLKKTGIADLGKDDKTLTYQSLIMICLNNTPKEGFTFAEMRARQRIEDTLNDAVGDAEITVENPIEVHFEDEDAKKLQELFLEVKWMTRHKDLIDFGNNLESMKSSLCKK